jgi:hypothetical protein
MLDWLLSWYERRGEELNHLPFKKLNPNSSIIQPKT